MTLKVSKTFRVIIIRFSNYPVFAAFLSSINSLASPRNAFRRVRLKVPSEI